MLSLLSPSVPFRNQAMTRHVMCMEECVGALCEPDFSLSKLFCNGKAKKPDGERRSDKKRIADSEAKKSDDWDDEVDHSHHDESLLGMIQSSERRWYKPWS